MIILSSMAWLADHAKESLETMAIVAGLFFTTASFLADAKERRISNLITMASSHRDLWLHASDRPDLLRVLKADANVRKTGVSDAEKRFVHLLITQLAVSYAAMKDGVMAGLPGLEKDVQGFFSLPIPRQVWEWSRQFQDPAFVSFVDKLLPPCKETKS